LTQKLDINKLQESGSLDLLARQIVEGYMVGLHKSPYHGFSVEFAEHRLYNRGESIRHIDWKLFGKTEKLFVKKYEEETNLRCQLVIDISPSMYYPAGDDINSSMNKISFSIYSAAALIYLLKKQRDAFGLSFFDDRLQLQTQNKTNILHQRYLYGKLESLLSKQVAKQHKTSTAKVLHEIAELLHQRSMVIIFTDMFSQDTDTDEIFAALQHLRHNKHEVILFHVYDSQLEMSFEFPNRPTHFIDTETKEEIKLSPLEIKREYQSKMQSFKEQIKIKSGQNKIDIIEADIHKGFYPVLSSYLLKRSKLY
jgi:uncharacterized protein (DUF58 family)